MSQRHDLEVICALAIHQQKREVPEWHSANGFTDRKSAYRFADRRTFLDQMDRTLDLGGCSNETLLRLQRSAGPVSSPSEDLSLDPRANVFPVTGREGTGIHRRATPLDLDRPGSIDIALSSLVQTLQEPGGDPRPFVLGKAEGLFE